ncbi:MAG: hypothetical protein JWM65_3157 [Sphingomonas bacterium]|nr:hypothetical protein [Sphingomonas bacterium]
MLLPILALLAAGTVQTDATASPDPHAVTCIAPRDRHGQPMARKICKTFIQWKRYVEHQRAVTAYRDRMADERAFAQLHANYTGDNANPAYPPGSKH